MSGNVKLITNRYTNATLCEYFHVSIGIGYKAEFKSHQFYQSVWFALLMPIICLCFFFFLFFKKSEIKVRVLVRVTFAITFELSYTSNSR